jgi:inositol-phosphate transport system permease protein
MSTTEPTTTIVQGSPRKESRDRLRSIRGLPSALVFVGPALILISMFFFIPVVIIIGISMTDMATATGFDNWSWVGLQNYAKIWTHPSTPEILWHTVFYVCTTLILFNVGLALLVAILTTHVPRRAGFGFRALWLLPRLTPSVVYVMMWRYMAADAPYGVINQHILGPLGIEPTNLLPAYPWVFVILVNGFIGASFGMIIFTSAIESIPKEYLMAALVDGCSMWQRIRYIILPMISWPLLFVTTYQTLSLLTSFEQILLLTDGQFGTEVWSLWAYHRALNNYWGNFQWGFGAALAGVLVVIGIVMAIIYMRYFRFNDLVQEPKIDAL